jgi:hypothetical protein
LTSRDIRQNATELAYFEYVYFVSQRLGGVVEHTEKHDSLAAMGAVVRGEESARSLFDLYRTLIARKPAQFEGRIRAIKARSAIHAQSDSQLAKRTAGSQQVSLVDVSGSILVLLYDFGQLISHPLYASSNVSGLEMRGEEL